MNSSDATRMVRGLSYVIALFSVIALCGVVSMDAMSAGAAKAGGGAAKAGGGAELAGSWAGGGSLALASGTKERASCRARYSKIGASSYAMSASCATASARVDQTATLRKTGANSYAGSFFNAQYNTGGAISVYVNGGSQSVSISGQAGSGHFNLRRL